MQRKYLLFGSMLIISSLLLAACGDSATTSSSTATSPQPTSTSPAMATTVALPQPTSTSPAMASELSLVDATKTTLTLTKKPERFACLTDICIDILAELGLEPVLHNSDITALPEYFGDKAKNFTKIAGGFAAPNLEDIAKAKPDFIIGLNGVHDKLRESLKTIAPIYIVNPTSYNLSIEYLQAIGRITGRTAQAEQARQKFLDKLADYKAKSPKNKTALLMFGVGPSIGIDTNKSLYGSLLAEVTNYPWSTADIAAGAVQGEYSLEKILAVDPDAIFITSFTTFPGAKKVSEAPEVSNSPIWKNLKAVKNNQIYEVNTAIWGQARGTRAFGFVLDEALNKLYPDVFKK